MTCSRVNPLSQLVHLSGVPEQLLQGLKQGLHSLLIATNPEGQALTQLLPNKNPFSQTQIPLIGFDPDGNIMTPEEVSDFLKTLP